jgi:alanyl-tRNA synthetase
MGDISTEICGGTHVSGTNQIEQFTFIKLSNKGTGS